MHKILIVTAVFPPEPVISAVISYDLASSLSNTEKVTVLCPRPTRPKGYQFNKLGRDGLPFDVKEIESFTCPESKIFGRLRESYSFGKHVAKYIKRNQNIISCIYINSWPLLSQYLIIKTSKQLHIPTILHIQDIYPESIFRKESALMRLLVRILLPFDRYIQQNSNQLVTISQNMKEYLTKSRKVEETSLQVVYNWTNGRKTLKKNTINKDTGRFKYMFLGSLSPTAALDSLITSFSAYNDKNVELIIAGNGSVKKMLQELAIEKNDNRIKFIDAPAESVFEIQSSADVLVLSLAKGAAQFALPSKLTSYMHSQKPILAITDADSDVSRVIKRANCGWVVEPDDNSYFIQLLQKVTNTSSKILNSYGYNGYKYSMTHFSKEKNLEQLHDIVINTIK